MYGWEGKLVRLAPLDRDRHLANAVAWMNDAEVTRWTLVGDFPMTRLAEEAFFVERAKAGPTDTDLAFAVETLAGEHIGFTGLHRIDWRHRFAVTGTLLGRKDCWGKGYGTDVAFTRSHYAFDVLGLETLLSECFAGNTASRKMLARAGYREAGVIPGLYFKRGARTDKIQLYCKRDDWQRAAASRG
jgi:RimJ/RimL family protein N-acetyltransferase